VKRCKCIERDRGKWKVVERRQYPLTSRLKCLRCGIKWWSKCKYVATLGNHVEYSQRGLTDQDILDRINTGTLWVEGEKVVSKSRKGIMELMQIHRESSGSKYHFVTVWAGNKKKKIAVHRLVWMCHHRSLVPDGFDVDHKSGKDIPNANAIENLQLLPSSVNRSRGKPNDDF